MILVFDSCIVNYSINKLENQVNIIMYYYCESLG